jgi:hypothetical protein
MIKIIDGKKRVRFKSLKVGDIVECKLCNREVLAICGKMIAVSRALSPGYDGWWTEETFKDKVHGQGWTGYIYLEEK